MSDFIPRTEEVRRRFWIGTAFRSDDQVRENAQFERWLEQHDAEVTAESEARIVKLLIEHKVIRVDALGSVVFVDCDDLGVKYLPTEVLGETE